MNSYPIDWERLYSVSYIHLDVYKRQVFNGDRVTFVKTYVRKKTLAAQKKEEDVYKRQHQHPKGCVCKGTSPLNPLSAVCHRLLSIVTKMLTYGSNKYSCTSSVLKLRDKTNQEKDALKAKVKALEGENEQLSDRLGKAILEKEGILTPGIRCCKLIFIP